MSSKSQVLFENIFNGEQDAGTLAVTNEAAGFPKENALDWRPYTLWKSSGTTTPINFDYDAGVGNVNYADAVGIAGHNFGDAAARVYVYHSDNGADYTAVVSQGAASPNGIFYAETGHTSGHRYWRVTLTKPGGFTEAPSIGALCLGRTLVFEEGPQADLDPWGRSLVADRSRNEHGAPLGTNRRYLEKTFQVNHMSPGMTRDGFYRASSGLSFEGDFMPHGVDNGKPFFFAPVYDEDVDYPTANSYENTAWLCECDSVSMPNVGTLLRRGLICQFRGWRP